MMSLSQAGVESWRQESYDASCRTCRIKRARELEYSLRRKIEEHLDRLYAYALWLSGEPVTAEDLVQEAVLRALAARSIPEDASGLRPWLFRILRNVFIDQLRRQGRMQLLEDPELEQRIDGDAGGWEEPEALVDEMTLRFALEGLPALQRDILNLIDIQGFSYAEAAEVLDVPIGTVMSRVSRARQALLERLAESNVLPLRRQKRSVSGR